MANSNGKITAPVSISDVQSALGGVQIYSLESLCKFNNINVMSLYKPSTYTGDTMSEWDSSNNTWKSNASWYKGTSNDYSIIIQGSTSFTDSIISRTTGGRNGWGLNSPTKYRLHDFAGYDHSAGRPIFSFPSSAMSSNQVTGQFSVASGNYVQFSNRLGNVYFGVAIVNQSSDSVRYYATNSTPGPQYVSFTPSGVSNGTYRIFPFFSTSAISAGGTPPSGTIFYPLPYVGPVSCVITSSTPSQSAYISITNGTNKSSPALYFKNSSSVTLGGCTKYTGSASVPVTWAPGTVTNLDYVDNISGLKYIRIVSWDGVELLPKTNIGGNSSGNLTLSTSFNATYYQNNYKILYVTFADS